MAYAKRYAGGFLDNAGGGTPIDSTFLNAVEAALLKLFAVDASADGQALLWSLANSRYQPALIGNANIDPAAAIAKSKLAALNITDADIAAAAGIAASKLGGNIPFSKLSGYPGDQTQIPHGDGSWSKPAFFRKTTTKQVLNSVVETDLLNAECTVPAGAMGLTGNLRLTALCDWTNASGAVSGMPRFKVKLGATTLIDTNSVAGVISSAGNVYPLKIAVDIMNLGASNSQVVHFHSTSLVVITSAGNAAPAVGTGNVNVSASGAGWAILSYEVYNTTAVDTTVANALALTVINPTATATCYTELRGAYAEIL